MKIWKNTILAAIAALGLGWAVGSTAQQPAPASVHGHVSNPAGQPLTSGDVKFTKDKTAKPEDRKYTNSFPIDASGNYKGERCGAGRLPRGGDGGRQDSRFPGSHAEGR